VLRRLLLIRLPGERTTPSGRRRNQALYVTTHDGTRIAIDVWLPEASAASPSVATL
jgi:predicted acyl esterase